jgi:hypothetical protein
VRSRGAGREADEVAALEGVLPVGRAQHERAVDDEQPFLVVLVVVRRLALTGRHVVDEHQGRARPEGRTDVDPALEVLRAEEIDRFHAAIIPRWVGGLAATA